MASFNRVAFTISGQNIYWYGIITAIAAILALISAYAREERVGLPKDTTLNVALLAIPVGFIVARIYYVVFAWESFSLNPISIFNIRQGGLAIWGGIIGGSIACGIYARIRHISFLRLADLLAPSLALAQGIGRWGNFVNQEAYGMAVTDPRFMSFPIAVWIDAQAEWFYATFFYESIWCIALFVLLILLEKKRRFRRSGDILLWYLLLYSFERFWVEGLRLDSLYMGTARISQLLSLILLLICLSVIVAHFIRVRGFSIPHIVLTIVAALSAAACIPALLAGAAPVWMILPAAVLLLFDAIWLYMALPTRNEV